MGGRAEIVVGEKFCGTRPGDSWCLCMGLRVHKCFIFLGNKSRTPDNGVDMSSDTVKDKVNKESLNEWRESREGMNNKINFAT